MRGQLSRPRNDIDSVAHGLQPRWWIPSSVMSSQWDRLCNNRDSDEGTVV